MRYVFGVLLASLCAGCASHETVQFRARAGQQALVRDGQSALASHQKNSIVLARPAARQFRTGGRPVFVIGIYNKTQRSLDFRVADVRATQTINNETAALKVITYEQLVSEEQTRQTIAAIGVGLAAAGNSMSAAQAGRYSSSSTVYAPRGTYQVETTGYNPTAAAIAQANANAENAAMISATVERGQANLASLERSVIKDNTLLPAEWYGGQLHLQPLISDSAPRKTYSIALLVGSDRHEIEIVQEAGR
jgi:hypothetical protein